jgi:hypothetical protein
MLFFTFSFAFSWCFCGVNHSSPDFPRLHPAGHLWLNVTP